MRTHSYKSILDKELNRVYGLSPHIDSEGRDRTVWRQCPQGRDWLILAATQKRPFAFRENILQGIEKNNNPAYAILLGSSAENWYVFKTDLMPLVEIVLERQERRMPQEDGSIYYEVYYEISTFSKMCLTDYAEIDLIELPELSELVNRA